MWRVELVQSLGYLNVTTPDAAPRPQDSRAATELAARARISLRLKATEPLVDLVNPLADLGLFAFSTNLGADSPDAATTSLSHGAVTIINSGRAVGRRRLALAHELGHYLLADPYTVDWRVGIWSDQERTEWLLDGFARAFLLPATSIKQRWTELKANGSVREAAVRLASEYRVDMSTLATRLSELGIASSEDASLIRVTTTKRSDIIEHDLSVAYDLEGTTLPRSYERAVLAAYRSERISAARAIDLLRRTIDESDLPALPPVNENEIWKFTS